MAKGDDIEERAVRLRRPITPKLAARRVVKILCIS
jgi:hypothetical protein